MDQQITQSNLPLLLAKARENIISHFRPILKHFGLTEQQWRVMRVLFEQGELEPCELCDACDILSPSMTGILKRLQEMELVDRKAMEGDKRRVLIFLTPKSAQLAEQILPLIQQQYQLIEQAWGAPLIRQIYADMEALVALKTTSVQQVQLPDKRMD